MKIYVLENDDKSLYNLEDLDKESRDFLNSLFEDEEETEAEKEILPTDLDEETLYDQLAEECAEFIQAVMKLKRVNGDNPTPKTAKECYENLKEEMGDILLCIDAISKKLDIEDELNDVAVEKYGRWLKRLNEGTD